MSSPDALFGFSPIPPDPEKAAEREKQFHRPKRLHGPSCLKVFNPAATAIHVSPANSILFSLTLVSIPTSNTSHISTEIYPCLCNTTIRSLPVFPSQKISLFFSPLRPLRRTDPCALSFHTQSLILFFSPDLRLPASLLLCFL